MDETDPERASGRESAWTMAVAGLAQADPPLAAALARGLLKTAGDETTCRRDLARELRARIPSSLVLVSEHYAYHDRFVDIWRRVFNSRIDWAFLGPDRDKPTFALFVEVKTNPKTGYQFRQLERYHRALKDLRVQNAGLLVVSPTVIPAVDLPKDRRRLFIGGVTWAQAAEELRSIASDDAELTARWHELLDEIKVPPRDGE